MVRYMYYLNYFFIFSILGHLLELILIGKSGILYGLWTPIYGIGVILILMLNKFIDKFKFKGFKKFIFLFFYKLFLSFYYRSNWRIHN